MTSSRLLGAVAASILLLLLPGIAKSGTGPNPVPILYPIIPAAVSPGSSNYTLTLAGADFVAGSTVYWNGTALSTTFVSTSQLTATVPSSSLASPGTATITVISPAPGGGTSNFQYFVVQDSVTENYWSSRGITNQVPILNANVAAGDFNNDGKADFIVASGSNVYVLAGNGDGTYQPAYGSAGPANSVIDGIHVADINNDGNLDLIINGKVGTTGFVATMLGNGNLSFQAPVVTNYSGPASAYTVVGDFNGDGIWDVALIWAGGIKTLLGNSNGTFQPAVDTYFSTYVGENGIAVADFNGDGIPDLLLTANDPSSTNGFAFVGVCLGNGDGTFQDISQVAGSGANYVGSITAAIGDFNGDGKLDIATAIQTAGPVIEGIINISLGSGNGTFTSAGSVPNVPLVTTPLLVGDFNADGNLDLATGGYFYYGEGNGSFPTSEGSANAPTFVLAEDANNDGLMDVIDENVIVSASTAALGIELQVPPLPDFKGIVGPLNTVLVPGSSASFTVTLEPLYGWTGDVTLGATDLPNGITPSYNPVTVKGGNGTSTITLTAAASVPLGNYTFNLSGNSGGLTHTTTLPITVNDSIGNFYGTLPSVIQNINQSASATYTINIVPEGGFTGPVVLSVTGLPAGASASFSQNPVTGGSGSSVLEITTNSSTPSPSVSILTLTAVSGTLSYNQTLYLGVAPNAESISGTITPSASVSSSAGGTASYSLNLATANNAAQADMSLAVSGVPAGASAAFTPSTINTGTGTSTLQVTVPAGVVPQGTYYLTITMTEDGSVAQQTVTLTVTP
jgi:FG-GAP-like repeat